MVLPKHFCLLTICNISRRLLIVKISVSVSLWGNVHIWVEYQPTYSSMMQCIFTELGTITINCTWIHQFCYLLEFKNNPWFEMVAFCVPLLVCFGKLFRKYYVWHFCLIGFCGNLAPICYVEALVLLLLHLSWFCTKRVRVLGLYKNGERVELFLSVVCKTVMWLIW